MSEPISKFKLFSKPKKNVVSAYSADVSTDAPPPAEDARFGWAGQDVAEKAFAKYEDAFPKFFISGQTEATDGKRMVLWEFSQKVLGHHIPTFYQQIGDCVSMGASNAMEYLQCVEIAKLGDHEKYRPIFQPYIYGISRVKIGGGSIRGDGSVGVWAAQGIREYGVIPADEPGVPAYSGDVARDWGRKGPPADFINLGKKHLLKSTAKVTNYPMVRDALVNGYPVTVASNRGFRMTGSIDKGKLWATPYGVWNHQMCIIGVDDDPKRPGCYIINSWGENAHGKPADDAPPGGFWVDANVIESMVKQNDSFAFSQFDGFPEQDLDFILI